MITIPKMSRLTAASVAAFGALSLVGAWIVVLGGGFNTDSASALGDSVFVGGIGGAFMAALQFLAALLAWAAVIAQFDWGERRPYTFAALLVVLPLLGYVAAVRL